MFWLNMLECVLYSYCFYHFSGCYFSIFLAHVVIYKKFSVTLYKEPPLWSCGGQSS
jgi:hypothetical protein